MQQGFSPEGHQAALEAALKANPIVPVVAVSDVEQAVSLARALQRGGIGIMEITLRTPVALDSLAAVRAAIPEMCLGAGTVLNAQQMRQAADIGCQFAVSPGATAALLAASVDADLPLLAGATTPSETQVLLEHGFRHQKFFPAEQSGGLAYLAALQGPLPEAHFCPTGGISLANLADYLSQPNVVAAGGSFVSPSKLVEAGNWTAIASLCDEALGLVKGI